MNRVALSTLLFASISFGVLGCSGGSPEDPADSQSSVVGIEPASVGATVTLLDGARFGIAVCADGSGLPPGADVFLSYSNVPGVPPFTVGSVGSVDREGAYSVKDSSEVLVGVCSAEALMGNVTVTVLASQDASPGPNEPVRPFATATIPAEFWCSNGSAGMDFNGGCH
jgi:hypothetical protein